MATRRPRGPHTTYSPVNTPEDKDTYLPGAGWYDSKEMKRYGGKNTEWWRTQMGDSPEEAAQSAKTHAIPRQMTMLSEDDPTRYTFGGRAEETPLVDKRQSAINKSLQISTWSSIRDNEEDFFDNYEGSDEYDRGELRPEGYAYRASRALARTNFPMHELHRARGEVNVSYDEEDFDGGSVSGYYQPKDQSVELHADDAGPKVFVHELGHRMHLAELDRSRQQSWLKQDPLSTYSSPGRPSGSASAIKEGVAEGTADRYAGSTPREGYKSTNWNTPHEQAAFDVMRQSVADTGRVPDARSQTREGKQAMEKYDAGAPEAYRQAHLNVIHNAVQEDPAIRGVFPQHRQVFAEADRQHTMQTNEYWEQPALFDEVVHKGNVTGYAPRVSSNPNVDNPNVDIDATFEAINETHAAREAAGTTGLYGDTGARTMTTNPFGRISRQVERPHESQPTLWAKQEKAVKAKRPPYLMP